MFLKVINTLFKSCKVSLLCVSVLTPFQLREISDYRNNTMYLDTVILLLLHLRLRVQPNFEYDVSGRMKRKFRNGKT